MNTDHELIESLHALKHRDINQPHTLDRLAAHIAHPNATARFWCIYHLADVEEDNHFLRLADIALNDPEINNRTFAESMVCSRFAEVEVFSEREIAFVTYFAESPN